MTKPHIYDVAIIGGGINGCGCAADAALRGLSVFLCEQYDIASQTSSRSSKLIHGGLRYLEHYDLALVKKALDEQQILMSVAPHLVHPLPFVLPCDPQGRAQWLLRTGLFLYDHLSRINQLPQSKHLDRQDQVHYFTPLSSDIQEGFLFYDCHTDDARLTLANALQAAKHHAHIATYTTLIAAEVRDQHWHLTLTSPTKGTYSIQAKALINAAGPWIQPVSDLLQVPLQYQISLVKGSHVVVHRLYEGEHAYLLQHEDHRVIFVIPFHGYSLIGTTDVPYEGDLKSLAITPEEITYLSKAIQHAFHKPLQQADIITSWSGVRTLLGNEHNDPAQAAALSRDYAICFTEAPAPAITLYGGKITTYRQLSQDAIDQLRPVFSDLTATKSHVTPLPGADTEHQASSEAKLQALWQHQKFSDYLQEAQERYYWLDEAVLNHYLKTYGTLTDKLLQDCHAMHDLGLSFTPILYQREVDYLIQNEWVTCVDDLLWRRTKFGLAIDAESYLKLADYVSSTTR